MGRMLGTVSMGIRAPIIREGDDLAAIVTGCILEAAKNGELTPRDRDVVAMTESIVARVQGNYVTVDDIAEDVRNRALAVPGVHEARVEIVWEPPWTQDMISEEGKMELGLI